jgi:hypothetical protein
LRVGFARFIELVRIIILWLCWFAVSEQKHLTNGRVLASNKAGVVFREGQIFLRKTE